MLKFRSGLSKRKMFLGGLSFAIALSALTIPYQGYSEDKITTTVTKEVDAVVDESLTNRTFVNIKSLDLVKNPDQFMEKDVVFTGVFNRFSDIGLDYPKALRETKDYVAMLLLRPDVGARTIPMSELKLFFPRKKSDDVLELDTGDEVEIKGNVFSNALGDPWVDVLAIKIVSKAPKKDNEKTEDTSIDD